MTSWDGQEEYSPAQRISPQLDSQFVPPFVIKYSVAPNVKYYLADVTRPPDNTATALLVTMERLERAPMKALVVARVDDEAVGWASPYELLGPSRRFSAPGTSKCGSGFHHETFPAPGSSAYGLGSHVLLSKTISYTFCQSGTAPGQF